jgi:hypothetical protein
MAKLILKLNCVGATSAPITRNSSLKGFVPDLVNILPHSYISLVKRSEGKKDEIIFESQGIHFTPAQFSQIPTNLQSKFLSQGIKFQNPTDDKLIVCESELRPVSDSKYTKSFDIKSFDESELHSLVAINESLSTALNKLNLDYIKFPDGIQQQTNCNSIAYTMSVALAGEKETQSAFSNANVTSVLPTAFKPIHLFKNGGDMQKLGFRDLNAGVLSKES